MTIRNPLEWGLGQFGIPGRAADTAAAAPHSLAPPVTRRIGTQDLRAALRAGLEDFAAARTDVVVLCIVYPVIGLLLVRLAMGQGVMPLLFPLAAGFALLGPLFAVGLNEMSRRRELGAAIGWADAFQVARSPAAASVALMGLLLVALFLAWLVVAGLVYNVTLGPRPPVSISAFAHDVFATRAGWSMIVLGMGAGFLFAVVALAVSIVSFPLILDRHVGIDTAISTSVRATVENPVTLAIWGLIVALALVIGSIPLFLGLTIVLPVLGHATWHLYRRIVLP